MRVGIRKGGALGALGQFQILEFDFAALESFGDLAQGSRLGQLTEEHGDELLPAGEPFGTVLRLEGAHVPN
jgi:hypothetical protein